MRSALFKNSSAKMVVATTIVVMFLNAVVPFDFARQAEATAYPFKLSATLEKTHYRLGEPVNVTVAITNIGTENITLYNSRDYVYFKVYDHVFNEVFRWGFTIALELLPGRPIAPGQKRESVDSWMQEYGATDPGGPKVPPGIYYITGCVDSSTYSVAIETSPMRIEIMGG